MGLLLGLALFVGFAVSLVAGFHQQQLIVEAFMNLGYTAHTAGLLGGLSVSAVAFGCAAGAATAIAEDCP